MAVTVLPTSSMSDSVKLAVRSTTTCSDTTVLSLQTLLRASSNPPEKPVRRTTKSVKEPVRPTSRAKTSRTTKTTSANDALHVIVDQDAPLLSPQEKLVLATEVFNTTLKTLTDALKAPNTTRSTSTEKASTKSTARSNPTGVDAGVVSAAECARLALSTLRALKNDHGTKEFPNMQLEQGVCVLAGKLITLGLNDMACKELRSLKGRIQQYLDLQKTVKKATGSNDVVDDESAKERMSDLLTFSNIANAQALYGLLVPFQANAMRLFASERKASTVQKLYPLLQLSEPSSPAQKIGRAHV